MYVSAETTGRVGGGGDGRGEREEGEENRGRKEKMGGGGNIWGFARSYYIL